MKLVDYSTADVLTILAKIKSTPSESLESETVEFKQFNSESSLHGSKELAEELCAFANHLGGVLIVGVKDSGNIHNQDWQDQLHGFAEVDKDETEKRIKGKIQNQINLRVENISFESKNYVAIYVVKNLEVLVTTTSGKIYIREGRDSRPMRPDEVEKAVKSLQNYDWSADNLQRLDLSELDDNHIEEAQQMYSSILKQEAVPTREKFLESIGVTKNGILTKGGLLFLGKTSAIQTYLGDYEFRFSWKEGTNLKINEVWSGNLWSSINKAKEIFKKCISEMEIEFKGNKFQIPNLDPVAFHEAFLNAVVHRDYSIGGMVSIEFSGNVLSITSPGLFYGGVTADNIAYHNPRHRNKSLARILMTYRLVDRAGMGILRMGINSLVYGRSFPTFEEVNECVRVSMQAEYIKPAIFVLTHGKQQLFLHDLILLNTLSDKAFMPLPEALDLIKKITPDKWKGILDFIGRWDRYVDLCGTKDEVYLRIKDEVIDFFELAKTLKSPQNSDKFVKLLILLKKHNWATNEEISNFIGYKQSQSTSRFLAPIKWIEKTGKGVATRYKTIEEYD